MYKYTIQENGYTILKHGVPYIVQTAPFFPFPAETLEESALNHIANQIEIDNVPTEENNLKSQIEQLSNDLQQFMDFVLENGGV